MKMQRVINKMSLLFVSVGAMIGAGYLMGMFYAAKMAGPAAIFSWMLGGVMVIIVSLTFSELSAMLPLAGGIARFPQFSHGALVSYIMTWLAWIAYALITPTEVQTLLQYIGPYFPQLIEHHLQGGVGLSPIGYVVAGLLLIVMSALNIYGIRLVTKFNDILVVLKLIFPVIVIITLLSVAFHGENFHAHGGFAPYGVKGIFASLPMAGVIFAFFGFRLSVELGGEVKNPQVALPLALIGSLVICMILYVILQYVFVAIVPPTALASGWAHLSFAGDSGPFVGIAAGLGLTWLIVILYLAAVISPFGSALMVVTTTARVNYAMSKNGYAPQSMLKLNQKGVPYVAIIINLIVGLILLAPLPGWQQLVGFVIAALVVSHSIVPIALVSLRKQVPNMHRPFRLPAGTLIALLAFVILSLIGYWTGWHTIWKMYVIGVIGLILLIIYRFTQTGEKPPLHAKHAWWLILYFVGMGIFSYYGNFGGGKGDLPFGMDMVYVAIFSIVIFFIAVSQRLPNTETEAQIEQERHLFPESYSKPPQEEEIF